MVSQFDLTRFYDVITRNSVFQLGFLTREFQIPKNNALKFWNWFKFNSWKMNVFESDKPELYWEPSQTYTIADVRLGFK